MSKCEACGVELASYKPVVFNHPCEKWLGDNAIFREVEHTPQRCISALVAQCSALRAERDEARREIDAADKRSEFAAAQYRRRNADVHAAEKRAAEAEGELAELRADFGDLLHCDYGPQGCMWNDNGENAVTHLRSHLEDLAKTYDTREPELMRALRKQRDEATAKLAEAEQWSSGLQSDCDALGAKLDIANAKLAEAEREIAQLKREYLCAECQHTSARAERFRAALEEVGFKLDDTHTSRCIDCHARLGESHKSDCFIGAALADSPDAGSEKEPHPAVCGIPSWNIGYCEEPWGHDGRMHSNGGDGFYVRDYDAEHERRQRIVSAAKTEKEGP